VAEGRAAAPPPAGDGVGGQRRRVAEGARVMQREDVRREAAFAAGSGLLWRPVRAIADRIAAGTLAMSFPDGTRHVAHGRLPGPAAEIAIRRPRLLARLVLGGSVAMGEAYVDGDWDSPDIAALVELAARNGEPALGAVRRWAPLRLAHRAMHRLRPNTRTGSRRNIAAHYDLGNDFFAAWLDAGMTYSAAMPAAPGECLEAAQERKFRAIATHAGLRPGMAVLEIGSGWGGFAELAARDFGCRVTGLTLSREQCAYANRRAVAAGLGGRVHHVLRDYRDEAGVYDAVVSIEMIEAVGERYWPQFFAALRDRLRPGGVAALQAITIEPARFDSYRRNADFVQRYVFPGGMLPTVDALGAAIAGAGLRLTDVAPFGPSYAWTLRRWHERFDAAWPQIAALGYDERFRRLWRYYLGYCEGGFRAGSLDVAHFRIVRP